MSMKAITVHAFGGPEVLKFEDIPAPTPGPGEVLIAVKAIGVNPVDTYIRSGIYGAREFPFTPGSDAVGVVEALGEGVTNVSVGDRVYVGSARTGAYAEKCISPASQVYKLPDNITFEQGAGVNVPYATAYRALVQRGQAKAGERLLVHGASGGVGIAAVQIARALGVHVTGTASTEDGLALVTREGAHEVLNHTKDGYLEGHSFDLILEMLANVNLERDLNALNKYGRVVVIGNRGSLEFNPRLTMAKEADVRGMSLFNAPPDLLASIHAALYAGLENGTLRPVVGTVLPLSEAHTAHEQVLKPGAQGKIVLLP
ncbi:MAG: NADPH:quinone reductase [Armatimonas sp.]